MAQQPPECDQVLHSLVLANYRAAVASVIADPATVEFVERLLRSRDSFAVRDYDAATRQLDDIVDLVALTNAAEASPHAGAAVCDLVQSTIRVPLLELQGFFMLGFKEALSAAGLKALANMLVVYANDQYAKAEAESKKGGAEGEGAKLRKNRIANAILKLKAAADSADTKLAEAKSIVNNAMRDFNLGTAANFVASVAHFGIVEAFTFILEFPAFITGLIEIEKDAEKKRKLEALAAKAKRFQDRANAATTDDEKKKINDEFKKFIEDEVKPLMP